MSITALVCYFIELVKGLGQMRVREPQKYVTQVSVVDLEIMQYRCCTEHALRFLNERI